MSLLDLQLSLQAHLLDASLAVAGRLKGDAASGLAVYHNAYRAQLSACLRDTFERTWSWLGDEAFASAALAHIETHPPYSWTLDAYGEDFPATLRKLYPKDSEVSELAWLDWSLRRAFDGLDAEPLGPEVLAEVDWDLAVLRLAPTLVMGEVQTNAVAIWGALARSEPPPPLEYLSHVCPVRVWRVGLEPRYRTIDALEREAIELCIAGCAFGQVCERISVDDKDGEASQTLGAMLASWIADGLVVGAA